MDLKLRGHYKGCSRIIVSPNLKATLTCPNCGKSKRQNVSNFFNLETPVKIKCKCSCQYSFSVRLGRKLSTKNVKFARGHINQYKSVIKKEKKYDAAVLIPIFFLIIAMLTTVFCFISDNGEPSKLSIETGHFNIIHHGEETKYIYDSSK